MAVLIVDGANVVGSVPDGWWRDRRAAATRLRDAMATLAQTGVGPFEPPLEVVLVVEGKARGVASSATVSVVEALGEGDDTIVELVRAQAPKETVVVTADRGLRDRVEALGAKVIGPRSVAYP